MLAVVDGGAPEPRFPVRLPPRSRDKLVYSAHVFGPNRVTHDYFTDHKFPHNLAEIWERHFGYLATAAPGQQPQHTVVVGEWGGIYVGRDQAWQDQFAGFLRRKRLSSFYWCLNPNSQDTGGLLTDSWTTPEAGKLQMLSRLTSFNSATGLPEFTTVFFDEEAERDRSAPPEAGADPAKAAAGGVGAGTILQGREDLSQWFFDGLAVVHRCEMLHEPLSIFERTFAADGTPHATITKGGRIWRGGRGRERLAQISHNEKQKSACLRTKNDLPKINDFN